MQANSQHLTSFYLLAYCNYGLRQECRKVRRGEISQSIAINSLGRSQVRVRSRQLPIPSDNNLLGVYARDDSRRLCAQGRLGGVFPQAMPFPTDTQTQACDCHALAFSVAIPSLRVEFDRLVESYIDKMQGAASLVRAIFANGRHIVASRDFINICALRMMAKRIGSAEKSASQPRGVGLRKRGAVYERQRVATGEDKGNNQRENCRQKADPNCEASAVDGMGGERIKNQRNSKKHQREQGGHEFRLENPTQS